MTLHFQSFWSLEWIPFGVRRSDVRSTPRAHEHARGHCQAAEEAPPVRYRFEKAPNSREQGAHGILPGRDDAAERQEVESVVYGKTKHRFQL